MDQPLVVAVARGRMPASTGRPFTRDLFLQRIAPEDGPGERTRAITAYFDVLRHHVARLERALYDDTKRLIGRRAFVGVHPTWSTLYPSIYQFEYFRNGLDWWEAPRDVAQVDEGVIGPVQLALGRRWNSPAVVKQVYAPTLQFLRHTVYEQTRIAGRVSYVASFGTDGGARPRSVAINVMHARYSQAIGRLERRTALLDRVARSLPKPTALVVFGYYAQAAWTVSNPSGDAWNLVEPGGNTGNQASEIARAMMEAGYVVDLVPSTEVDAGRVGVDRQGRATYGSARYDAAVLAMPQLSRRTTFAWASEVRDLGVVGTATSDAAGKDVRPLWARVRAHARVIAPALDASPTPTVFLAPDATSALAARVIAARLIGRLPLRRDPVRNGSLLEDGTVLIAQATSGSRPPRHEATVRGHRIRADGGTVFAAHLDRNGALDRVAGDGLRRVTVDGRAVMRFAHQQSVALVRSGGRKWTMVYTGKRPRDSGLPPIDVARSLSEERYAQAPSRFRLRLHPRSVRCGRREHLTVLVSHAGRPLPGARVTLGDHVARSDARGRATLRPTLTTPGVRTVHSRYGGQIARARLVVRERLSGVPGSRC